jgi:hypothetical protein
MRQRSDRSAGSRATARIERISPEVRASLEEIYREVDREVESLGAVCWARGDCCDFDRVDHKLYATWIEVAHVRDKHPEEFAAGSRLCPFWREGKCTERERRPLGCRTHFCDARYRDQLEAIHERHHGRLREIVRQHDLPWAYADFIEVLRSPAPEPEATPGETSHSAPGESAS